MAEILRKNIDNDTTYAVWHIAESVEELRLLICLREEEEKRYGEFVAESRKKQWLAYRILVRDVLRPLDFPVEYDATGRPYLAGSDYHISVTHSGDLAAVIISRRKVGIDLEQVRSRIEKVRHRFINETELGQISEDTALEQMTLVWCAKEALYKYFGKRALDFRDHICVEVPGSPGGAFNAEIRFEGLTARYRLFSEKIRDSILVYLAD
jgi:phosphopantetheinyl transferase